MPTVATWNVNSIRPRLPQVTAWLSAAQPDVVLLQETKVVDDVFPREPLEDLGYNLAVHGQKTYNGVAILSKYPIEDVRFGLPGDAQDTEARYIEGVISTDSGTLRVASVYVPNGQSRESEKFAYKLRFFERLRAHVTALLTYDEMLVIGGDFNVAPEAADVYDPAHMEGKLHFLPEERAAWRALAHLGLTDAFRALSPESHTFSWWDYRGGWDMNKGLRIDHLFLSPQAADRLQSCEIHVDERGKEKPSDHVPVMCAMTDYREAGSASAAAAS